MPGYDNMMQWEGGNSDREKGTVMGKRVQSQVKMASW